MLVFCALFCAAAARALSPIGSRMASPSVITRALERATLDQLEFGLIEEAIAQRTCTRLGQRDARALRHNLATSAEACAARYQPVADALLLLEFRGPVRLEPPPLRRPERDVGVLLSALGLSASGGSGFAAPLVGDEGVGPLDVLRDLETYVEMLAELAAWGSAPATASAVSHLARLAVEPFVQPSFAHPASAAAQPKGAESAQAPSAGRRLPRGKEQLSAVPLGPLSELRDCLRGAVVSRASTDGGGVDGGRGRADDDEEREGEGDGGAAGQPTHLLALSSAAFPRLATLRAALARARVAREACARALLLSSDFEQAVGARSGMAAAQLREVDGRLGVAMEPVNRSAVGRTLRLSRSKRSLVVEPRALRPLSDATIAAAAALRAEEAATVAGLRVRVREAAPALARAAEHLAALDVAMACGALGCAWQGRIPSRIGERGVFRVHQLRNPALAALAVGRAAGPSTRSVIAHDVHLGHTPADAPPPPAAQSRSLPEAPLFKTAAAQSRSSLPEARSALVLSGPNGGGKTALLKSIGLAALLVRAGVPLPAGAVPPAERAADRGAAFQNGGGGGGAGYDEGDAFAYNVLGTRALVGCGRVDMFDTVLTDLAAETSIESSASTFMARLGAHREMLALCAPERGAHAEPATPAAAATHAERRAAGEASDAAEDGALEPARVRSVLVLLDELGSVGSEPATSAALAVGTLEAFLNATDLADRAAGFPAAADLGADDTDDVVAALRAAASADGAGNVRTRVVATTHAHELKAFALADARVACGALLTTADGQPTFAYVTDAHAREAGGSAAAAVGKSDALAAAARARLPPSLIARARQLAGPAADALRRLDSLADSVAEQLARARADSELLREALEAAQESRARASAAERAAESALAAARAQLLDLERKTAAAEAERKRLAATAVREPSAAPPGALARAELPADAPADEPPSPAEWRAQRAARLAPLGLRPLSRAELLAVGSQPSARGHVRVASGGLSEWDGWAGTLLGVAHALAADGSSGGGGGGGGASSASALRALVRICVIPPQQQQPQQPQPADAAGGGERDADATLDGYGEWADGGVYEDVAIPLDQLAVWDDGSAQPAQSAQSAAALYAGERPTAAEAWARLVAEDAASKRAAEASAPPPPLSRRAVAAKLKRNASSRNKS
jgi:hypothetical protein